MGENTWQGYLTLLKMKGYGTTILHCNLSVKQSDVSHSDLSHFVTPRNSPGQNTGVGSLSLLQRIFPTQESNQGLLQFLNTVYSLQ